MNSHINSASGYPARMKGSRFDNMVFIAGGAFTMGSETFYPEEKPLRRVLVDRFWIDSRPVTNSEFAEFVSETGYVTSAEVAPDPADYPGMDPSLIAPGSLVFTRTAGPVPLDRFEAWWRFVLGADWRHPTGPDSSLDGMEHHPVVHVTHEDALAFAIWAGKSLPTEAEWEFAARCGYEKLEYAWGNELHPEGRMLANTWQGAFPHENTLEDGWERTSPVGAYPANNFDIFDMIGNVWEWTSDWYSNPKVVDKEKAQSCCTVSNPRGALRAESFDPCTPQLEIPRRVMKGGSHLCAPSYCQRYRPAARQGQAIDTSTSHIGFRCIVREN